ncbi:Methyl-accepting chemotaxis protein PctB [Marinomonas spartinae]|uniref:Methyl-accepting chemotaxis protein PctB n=1 Tax=Marinomonas spartinae TaxID=1792290 RepID=A0A1A8T425_9GAMM|nr:methyl-accepting chemotaxis protein [Marinomonas spartinae]SBS26650.1 Methyl-accepting chemotaxis protein PctB [Marinomonas spartinae]SBS40242.1 Methyl-accepting chemotaxis protein PctB [Marinomonas spartinae]
MSIRYILILSSFLVVTLAMVIMTAIMWQSSTDALRQASINSHYRTSNTIADQIATSVRFKKESSVSKKVGPYLEESKNDLKEVSVFLADGELLYSSLDGKVAPIAVDDMAFNDGTEIAQQTGAELSLVTRLTSGKSDSVVGYVRSNWRYSSVIALEESLLTKALLIGGGILVVTLLGLFLMIRQVLEKPIKRFTYLTGELSSGNGDLSQRIHYDSSNEFGQLAHHINTFIEKLEGSFTGLQGSAEKVSNVSISLERNVEQLEEKIRLRREDIKETLALGNELQHSVDSVKERIETASESLEQAVEAAQQGQSKLQEAVERNRQLAKSTKSAFDIADTLNKQAGEVSGILEIIRDIADQTNLLALNAAIEAARAGETGRGFAVVADEVRSLAEKTSNSTDQVEDILTQLLNYATDLVGSMEQGLDNSTVCVEATEEASSYIEDIIEKVSNSNRLNLDVVQTNQQQHKSMEHMSNRLIDLDRQMDDLFHDSQQMTEHSKDLLENAESTKDSLSSFSTR